jgi:hypothetical protein
MKYFCNLLFVKVVTIASLNAIHTSKHIITKGNSENEDSTQGLLDPFFTVLWACRYGSNDAYITDGWEGDYIRELFPSPKFFHTQNVHVSGKVVVYNTLSDLHFIQQYITENEVLILVHLSDEFQGLLDISTKGKLLYDLVPIVLRQYSFHMYRSWSAPLSNVMQIPLGYMTGMFFNNQSGRTYSSSHVASKILRDRNYKIKLGRHDYVSNPSIDMVYLMPIKSKREYNWSFIGNPFKSDRQQMLSIFSTWEPYLSSNSLTATETAAVYKKSKFVIVGRGQFSIECFRIYEALINGAVPVIVADEKDIYDSFIFGSSLRDVSICSIHL